MPIKFYRRSENKKDIANRNKQAGSCPLSPARKKPCTPAQISPMMGAQREQENPHAASREHTGTRYFQVERQILFAALFPFQCG